MKIRSKDHYDMPPVMVQIRNVPEEVHRRLKARAAIEGMSMSDYILREIGKALERPTRAEVLERLRARPVRRLRTSPAAVIRAERDAR
jgi:antitoxin FitA